MATRYPTQLNCLLERHNSLLDVEVEPFSYELDGVSPVYCDYANGFAQCNKEKERLGVHDPVALKADHLDGVVWAGAADLDLVDPLKNVMKVDDSIITTSWDIAYSPIQMGDHGTVNDMKLNSISPLPYSNENGYIAEWESDSYPSNHNLGLQANEPIEQDSIVGNIENSFRLYPFVNNDTSAINVSSQPFLPISTMVSTPTVQDTTPTYTTHIPEAQTSPAKINPVVNSIQRNDSNKVHLEDLSISQNNNLVIQSISPVHSKYNKQRLCEVNGCLNRSRAHKKCKKHGGVRQCSFEGCTKNSQSRGLCIGHGGGSRCRVEGCIRASQSRGLCKGHGGGKNCIMKGCIKKAHLRQLCRMHGGGERCHKLDCLKWSQRQGYCMAHAKELFPK